ncbi:MAG TPA: A24 family peptidase [Micromonosporaceae bacterium]
MSALLIGGCALACAVAGSMVPPFAYRLSVPYGEPARGSCMGCAAPLPSGRAGWLRSRCGDCGRRLGPHRWMTGAIAGLAGGLLAAALGPVAVLPLFLGIGLLGVLLGAIDVACHRLPDPLVLPALGLTPVLLAGVATLTGGWDDWLRALLAFLLLGSVFTGMALLPGGGFGMGDAKVAALLGWYLGWLGWPQVLFGAVLPWMVNAPLLLVLLASGRVGWKTRMAFGPPLLIGWLLAVLTYGHTALIRHW